LRIDVRNWLAARKSLFEHAELSIFGGRGGKVVGRIAAIANRLTTDPLDKVSQFFRVRIR
jgi:hypothetical protein